MPVTRFLVLFVLTAVLVAGCNSARSVRPTDDAGSPAGDAASAPGNDADIDAAAPDAGTSCSCPPGQICSAGACVSLPSSCPCPTGSYCDLATNTCIAGCATHDDCAALQICDTATRTCVAGCRSDVDCALGTLCDATMHCAPGCRDDTGCPASSYCEPIEGDGPRTGTCRPRCSAPGDPACGADGFCAGDRCRSCGEDDVPSPDLPRLVDLGSSNGGLICPAADVDYFNAAIRCSGTCSGSVAVTWTIDVPTGLVPTCDYTVEQLGVFETRASRLTGPMATAAGDRWVCEPLDTTLFEYVSSEMFFQLAVGLSGSGYVTVRAARLR